MPSPADWKSTSCILCSVNCGLQVQIEDGHFKKIKGDKTNPRSNRTAPALSLGEQGTYLVSHRRR